MRGTMKIKKYLLWFFIVLTVLLSSCTLPAPRQSTDQGFYVDKKFDTNLYTVVIEADDLTSHENFNLSGSGTYVNGIGFSSVSAWTDGKGILRGRLIDIEPYFPELNVQDIIIVKTTDLKVQMIKDGDIVTLKCVGDYEPVAVKNQEGEVVEIFDIWELDYCRLVSIAVE